MKEEAEQRTGAAGQAQECRVRGLMGGELGSEGRGGSGQRVEMFDLHGQRRQLLMKTSAGR